MQRYRNLNGQSGVLAYALMADAIDVEFVGGAVYHYDYANTGRAEVETMKWLAQTGKGLSTFISQCVGDRYAEKIR
jgi:hypothetical protein